MCLPRMRSLDHEKIKTRLQRAALCRPIAGVQKRPEHRGAVGVGFTRRQHSLCIHQPRSFVPQMQINAQAEPTATQAKSTGSFDPDQRPHEHSYGVPIPGAKASLEPPRHLQDVLGLAQLAQLPLKILGALELDRRRPIALPRIALMFANPVHHGLRRAADLLGDRHDGGPLRFVLAPVLEHHAHGLLPDFRRKLRLFSHGFIQSSGGSWLHSHTNPKDGHPNAGRSVLSCRSQCNSCRNCIGQCITPSQTIASPQ